MIWTTNNERLESQFRLKLTEFPSFLCIIRVDFDNPDMKKLKLNLPKFFFLFLVLLVTAGFLEIIQEFLLAIFWAVVLAILFRKGYEKVLQKSGNRPNLAAGITVFFIILLGILPITGTLIALVNQVDDLITVPEQSADISIDDRVEEFRDRLPIEKSTLKALGFSKKKTRKKVLKAIESMVDTTINYVFSLTQNLFSFIANLFLTIYLLFYFLRDGQQMVQDLILIVPMDDKLERDLFMRFESVTIATVRGSLVVAVCQGIAGGVMFWALGIDGVIIWTILMILTSLLPIGSAIIWFPWVCVFFMNGEITKAIILLVVGTAFISLIDNLLRPRLIGENTKMPDYMILVSTLGGLAYFGLSGFVIGPVFAALFLSCWQIMGKKYGSLGSKKEKTTIDILEKF